MRQLGDLAFLLQNYELSYQTYNSARKDYQVDHAWLLYAGAMVSNCNPQSKCTHTHKVINVFCHSLYMCMYIHAVQSSSMADLMAVLAFLPQTVFSALYTSVYCCLALCGMA